MKIQTALIYSAAMFASTMQTGALALEPVTGNLSADRPALAAGDASSPVKVAAESSAAETPAGEDAGKTTEGEPKKSGEKGGKFKLFKGKSIGPGAMAAFVAGTVVGLPVAFVRSTVDETEQANRDLIKESKNPILVVPATILALPFTVPIGTLFGSYHAIKNSWANRSDKPFSKDAFSMGDNF